MRITSTHTQYITNKILLDLVNSNFVDIVETMDALRPFIKGELDAEVAKEDTLNERVKELLDEQEDEIEFMQIDRRTMFYLIKKKLADEYDFLLNREDRFNYIAQKILLKLIDEDLINFNVSENRVKNLIYNAMQSYLSSYDSLEDIVLEKMDSFQKKLISGTQEYELVFERLYQEELRKKGLM